MKREVICFVGGVIVGVTALVALGAGDSETGRYQIAANHEYLWLVDTRTGALRYYFAKATPISLKQWPASGKP